MVVRVLGHVGGVCGRGGERGRLCVGQSGVEGQLRETEVGLVWRRNINSYLGQRNCWENRHVIRRLPMKLIQIQRHARST